MNKNTRIGSVLVVVAVGLSLVACASEAEDEGEEVASATQELSGGCSSSFDACVRGQGGASCASRYCTGSCVSSVATCVRGGGGVGCKGRCTGVACTPKSIYTAIATDRCGFQIPPFEGTLRGEAMATCTQQCDGRLTNCNVWTGPTGRPNCTKGYPVDLAGNPL